MNNHQISRGNPVAKWLLLVIATIILLALLPGVLTRPRILAYDDSIVYWATGRLNAQGQNPYDPERLLNLERTAGRPL